MTKVYLAGACAHVDDEGKLWRERASEMLNKIAGWQGVKVDVVDPTAYFTYSEKKHKTNKQVKDYFLYKIRQCDIVLCNLEDTDKSCGTAQETQFAVDHHIPVIGFGTKNVYPWIAEVDCQVAFDTMSEAIDYIRDYYLG